jgi:hypothetical protein
MSIESRINGEWRRSASDLRHSQEERLKDLTPAITISYPNYCSESTLPVITTNATAAAQANTSPNSPAAQDSNAIQPKNKPAAISGNVIVTP